MSVMSNVRENSFSSVGPSSSTLLNVLAMNQFTNDDMQKLGMDKDVFEPSVSSEDYDEDTSPPSAEENPKRPRRRLRKLQEDSPTNFPTDSFISLKNKRDEYNDFFKPVVNLLHVPLNYSSVSKDCSALRLREIEDYQQTLPDNVIFKRPLTPEPLRKRRPSCDEVVETTNDAPSTSFSNLPPNFLANFLGGSSTPSNWNSQNLSFDPTQLLSALASSASLPTTSSIPNSATTGYPYYSPSAETNSTSDTLEEPNNIFFQQSSPSSSTETLPQVPLLPFSVPNTQNASASNFPMHPSLRLFQSLPNFPLNTQNYLAQLSSLLNGANAAQPTPDLTAFGSPLFNPNYLSTNLQGNIPSLSQYNNYSQSSTSTALPARKKVEKLTVDHAETAALFQKKLLEKNKANDEASERYQTMLRMKQASNEKIHTCSYCLLFFRDEAMYKMHAALHHPLNAWTCSLCGMECNNRLFFNVHIIAAKHEQAKPKE